MDSGANEMVDKRNEIIEGQEEEEEVEEEAEEKEEEVEEEEADTPAAHSGFFFSPVVLSIPATTEHMKCYTYFNSVSDQNQKYDYGT